MGTTKCAIVVENVAETNLFLDRQGKCAIVVGNVDRGGVVFGVASVTSDCPGV